MPIEAGENVLGGEDLVEQRGDDGTVSAGDAVMIDANGDMASADTESGDLAGVMTETNNLGLEGVYVAAASGVAEGDKVQAGNATGGTTGQFITGGNDGLALSAVGGSWMGMNVPSGYAVIKLK